MNRIPAMPEVGPEESFQTYELHRGTPWEQEGIGTFTVVDIALGCSYELPRDAKPGRDFFVHIPDAAAALQIVSNGELVRWNGSLQDYGQLPSAAENVVKACATRHDGQPAVDPVRIVLMQRLATEILPGFDRSCHLPLEDRPAGITLRSLRKNTHLSLDAGYEDVSLDGMIPRHKHERSHAIWLVISGEGFVGQDVDGQPTVTPITAGCWGCFPAGDWHGFYGEIRVASGQIYDIGQTDYVFDPNVEYRYQE